jgi:Domain of unknown function (DUF4405)
MKSLRPWATPLTVATTLVTLVTGVLLFFHWSPGLTRVSHEWIGMIMVLAVAAHLVLNYRAFFTYFKRPVGLTLMAIGAVAMAGTLLLSSGEAGGGPNGFRAAMGAMSTAKIETLAELSGKDLDTVLAGLSAAGYPAEAGQTLSVISGGEHANEEAIMGVIFAR